MPAILALQEAEGPQTGSHPGLHRDILSLKSERKNKKKMTTLENANSLLVCQRKIIRKEARTHAIYNMAEIWGHCAKWHKPVIKINFCMFKVSWISKTTKSRDRKENVEVRVWGQGGSTSTQTHRTEAWGLQLGTHTEFYSTELRAFKLLNIKFCVLRFSRQRHLLPSLTP